MYRSLIKKHKKQWAKRSKRQGSQFRKAMVETLEGRLVLTGISPIALNDTFVLPSNSTYESAAPGVLANDTDAESDPLTAELFSGPSHGSLTLNEDGSFSYTPDEGFVGFDSFLYRAGDGTSFSDLAGVTLRIRGDNIAPVAIEDTYLTGENETLTVGPRGVLQNDTDADGDSLIAELLAGPEHGELTLNGDGSFTYTPEADFSGEVTFTYLASDGAATSNVGTVRIIVDSINQSPQATNDQYVTNEDETLTISATGVLGNDSDPDGDPVKAILVNQPQHGTVTLNEDGSFVYTPNPNYHGIDGFGYQASDGSKTSDAASVTITVGPMPDAPVATGDSYTTDENTLLEVAGPGVLGNDTDVDGDALAAEVVDQPEHGTLILEADGSFSYEPEPGFSGSDRFTYRAGDGVLTSDITEVAITVVDTNDPAVTVNDNYEVDEDTALTISGPGVLENDSDSDGDTLTAVLVAQPEHGSVALNADGSFTYTPNADFNGVDGFTYQIDDGTELSDVASVTIQVNATNDDPLAVDDNFATDEDVPLTISTAEILANDSDVDGDSLVASLLAGPSNGTVEVNEDGSFTYTPAANFSGTDTFTYQAGDGITLSAAATVTISVAAVNDTPLAENDRYSTNEDTALEVATDGLLANDSDPEGGTLTAILLSQPENGTVELNEDGTFTYTPHADFHGVDGFTYQVTDGELVSDVASVTIEVQSVNDVPIAADDAFTFEEDTVFESAVGALFGNDSDVEGDALEASLVSDPTSGSVTVNADGSFTYTPNADFHGEDTFTYQVSDGSGVSNVATVTLTIEPVNDAPLAANDQYSTTEDTTLEVATEGVLANDSDIDSESLTVTLVQPPEHGTVELAEDGTFTYTPNADFHGVDGFTYQVSDGELVSDVAAVTIEVQAANDLPVAGDDSFTVTEDNVLEVAGGELFSNDSDADGDQLSATLISDPTNGDVTLNADGSFSYTPHANFHGEDTFTYQVSDGTGVSNVATVTLTIEPVNDAPVAVNDQYETDEDTPLEITTGGLLDNDTDIDGDPLTVSLVQPPEHGTVELADDGTFVYTPAANFNGVDGFSYQTSDGTTTSDVATVTIEVSARNDNPFAVGDVYHTDEDTSLTIEATGVLGNDTDLDGDALQAVLVEGPAHGVLNLNADGSFHYEPEANFAGEDTFTYQATDGQGTSEAVTVTIQVAAVNDGPQGRSDQYSVAEDTTLEVSPTSGVLRNDTDLESDSLSVALDSMASHGTVELQSDGSFVYQPSANFHGVDSFSYTASDGTDTSDPITVQISVNSVNDAPQGVADEYNVAVDGSLEVDASEGVMANDTDVDLDTLSATLIGDAQHGSVVLAEDGSFSYSPEAGFVGTDTFTYQLNDGQADSDLVTVSIVVGSTAENNLPVAVDDNYSTAVNTALEIAATGVLGNDSDADGQPLTVELAADATNGVVTLNADGSFVYTPGEDFAGEDTFTYRVSDGVGVSNEATVTIQVGVTTPPAGPHILGVNEAYRLTQNETLEVSAPGVLANDIDQSADPLTAVLFSDVQHGSLTLGSDGSFSYTPDVDFVGIDSFTYRATDGVQFSALTAVTLRVLASTTPTPSAVPLVDGLAAESLLADSTPAPVALPPLDELATDDLVGDPQPTDEGENASEDDLVETLSDPAETTDELVFGDGSPQIDTDEISDDDTLLEPGDALFESMDGEYLAAVDELFADLNRYFA